MMDSKFTSETQIRGMINGTRETFPQLDKIWEIFEHHLDMRRNAIANNTNHQLFLVDQRLELLVSFINEQIYSCDFDESFHDNQIYTSESQIRSMVGGDKAQLSQFKTFQVFEQFLEEYRSEIINGLSVSDQNYLELLIRQLGYIIKYPYDIDGHKVFEPSIEYKSEVQIRNLVLGRREEYPFLKGWDKLDDFLKELDQGKTKQSGLTLRNMRRLQLIIDELNYAIKCPNDTEYHKPAQIYRF